MSPDLPLAGKLREFSLPKVLVYLQRVKKTGTLFIRRNDQEKLIFVKEGDVIFSASRYRDDWLGEKLLKAGRISLRQYTEASESTIKTKKRFGTVMVESGVLTPKELFLVVTQQVKDIILSLFTWIDGEYRFEEGPLPTQEVITLRMSTANLILDGIRRINDFTRLRSELPPMDSLPTITADPMILFQDIQLNEVERGLLGRIDGKRRFEEIFDASDLPAFETLKLLHFFLSIGLVELSQTGPPLSASSPQAAAETSSPSAAEKTSEQEAQAMAEELIQEVREEQREAVQERQEEIFHREAEMEITKKKIRQAYDGLAQQNHYEVLGLDREASRDEIKRAYFHLAKEYHPDRHFQTGLEDLMPVLESLFRRITEAYDTLLMERRRKEYDLELTLKPFESRRGGSRASAGGSASQSAAQGEEALRKEDFKTAVYYLEAAVKSAPDKGKYHALLAKALTQIPGRQRDAETHYKRAIELEPAAADYYVGLGLLYKKGGMMQRAQRQFEEALNWDSDNAPAKKELKNLLKP